MNRKKSPYFDKNKKRLFMGDDIRFNGKEGYQIRKRGNKWVIYPIGALCYFPISKNDFASQKNIISCVEKINSITICAGNLICQEWER